MLRQVQHERIPLPNFFEVSVRPELVEGRVGFFQQPAETTASVRLYPVDRQHHTPFRRPRRLRPVEPHTQRSKRAGHSKIRPHERCRYRDDWQQSDTVTMCVFQPRCPASGEMRGQREVVPEHLPRSRWSRPRAGRIEFAHPASPCQRPLTYRLNRQSTWVGRGDDRPPGRRTRVIPTNGRLDVRQHIEETVAVHDVERRVRKRQGEHVTPHDHPCRCACSKRARAKSGPSWVISTSVQCHPSPARGRQPAGRAAALEQASARCAPLQKLCPVSVADLPIQLKPLAERRPTGGTECRSLRGPQLAVGPRVGRLPPGLGSRPRVVWIHHIGTCNRLDVGPSPGSRLRSSHARSRAARRDPARPARRRGART